jgi:hypothetical protein
VMVTKRPKFQKNSVLDLAVFNKLDSSLSDFEPTRKSQLSSHLVPNGQLG